MGPSGDAREEEALRRSARPQGDQLACNKDQLIKVCIRGHGQNVVTAAVAERPGLPEARSKNLPTDIAHG